MLEMPIKTPLQCSQCVHSPVCQYALRAAEQSNSRPVAKLKDYNVDDMQWIEITLTCRHFTAQKLYTEQKK